RRSTGPAAPACAAGEPGTALPMTCVLPAGSVTKPAAGGTTSASESPEQCEQVSGARFQGSGSGPTPATRNLALLGHALAQPGFQLLHAAKLVQLDQHVVVGRSFVEETHGDVAAL